MKRDTVLSVDRRRPQEETQGAKLQNEVGAGRSDVRWLDFLSSVTSARVMKTLNVSPWITVARLGAFLLVASMLASGCGSTGKTAADGVPGSSSEVVAPQTHSENTPDNSSAADARSPGAETSASDGTDEPVKVLRTDQIREHIEDIAEDWYGVPYEWSGESMDGIDCSAFVQRVYQQAFSYRLPRVTETQVQTGSKVPRSEIRPGDLVFFRPKNQWNHVGVYLGNRTFAHASSSDGVTESNLDKSYWKQYYWTARRPLKPSVVPDSLASELVAYRYSDEEVEADTTGSLADQHDQKEEVKEPETERPEPDAITIASCNSAEVECADEALSGAEASGSQRAPSDTTTRKGW